MYYEDRPRKKNAKAKTKAYVEQPAPRKKKPGCFSRMFQAILFALVVWAIVVLVSNLPISNNSFGGLFGGGKKSADLMVNEELPGGYTNILLLGTDRDENGSNGRSDSIMVASIADGGAIKLTSIMRDTMLDMGDKGTHKLNAAYKLGGGELTMYTVNKAFSMNITKYAAVDFEGLSKVIDSMGGIELNITKAEMGQINDGLKKAYKKKRVFNGVLMEPLTEYGKNIHMSGTHALFYSRIRNIDSDYKRAERQRILLNAMMQKARKIRNPIALASLSAAVLQCTTTNISMPEMIQIGTKVLMGSGDVNTYRLPGDGAFKETMEGGVWMIKPSLKKCKQQIYEFIYG